jgi:hypothetical protein
MNLVVKLADLVDNTAQIMRLDLARIRLATRHAGLKGTGAEEILARFLRTRLPSSLGVTTGHVVDANGQLSRQADVIIYDAVRTPVLFQSALEGWDVVPAEGVLAVIEVKMHLRAADLSSIATNCKSVMDLDREAYIGPAAPRFTAHGTSWPELPIYYSLFAFESDSTYAAALNELLRDREVHERIGSVCYLDRGVNLHADMAGGVGTFSALPTPLATLFDVPTSNALLVWFTSLSTVLFQAGGRPIDLMRYAPDEHRLLGSLPATSPEEGRRLATRAGEQVLESLGLDPRIAEKILNRQPLSTTEVEAITAVGGNVEPGADGDQRISLPTPPSQH